MDQAISWFDIAHINKGASRIDFEKLANLNAKYIDASSTDRLLELINLASKDSNLCRMTSAVAWTQAWIP